MSTDPGAQIFFVLVKISWTLYTKANLPFPAAPVAGWRCARSIPSPPRYTHTHTHTHTSNHGNNTRCKYKVIFASDYSTRGTQFVAGRGEGPQQGSWDGVEHKIDVSPTYAPPVYIQRRVLHTLSAMCIWHDRRVSLLRHNYVCKNKGLFPQLVAVVILLSNFDVKGHIF